MVDDKKNGMMNGGMCPGCHSCGCTGRGRHWTFFLLRVILTILILMIVFWFGVAAGRLSDAGLGRYGMMRDYSNGGNGTGAWPMMPINGATSTATGGVQNY
jgi:hypothetical protein